MAEKGICAIVAASQAPFPVRASPSHHGRSGALSGQIAGRGNELARNLRLRGLQPQLLRVDVPAYSTSTSGINQLGTFHDPCVGGAHRQSSCRSFRGASDSTQTGGRHVIPHVIKQLSRHVIPSRLPLMRQYASQSHPL